MAAPSVSASGTNKSTTTTGTTTPSFTLPGTGVQKGIGVVFISVKNAGFTFSSLPSGWSELARDANGNGNDTIVVLSGPITAGQTGTLTFTMSGAAMWFLTWALVPNGVVNVQNVVTNGSTAVATHAQCTANSSPYTDTLTLLFCGGRGSASTQTSLTPFSAAPGSLTIQQQGNTALSTNNMIGGIAWTSQAAAGTTQSGNWTTGGNWFTVSAVVNVANAPQSATMAGKATDEAFGAWSGSSVSGPISVTMAGVASAEAEGNISATPGAISAPTMTGVASAQAFGNPSVTLFSLALAGIATGAAYGTITPVPGPASLTMVAVATAEAFGTPNAQIKTFHSFEAGTSGSAVMSSAPTDGSSQFDISQVTGAGSTIQIDTAWAHTGTRSFKSTVSASTAASAGWSSAVLGSLAPHILVRGYFRWTATPPDKSRFFTMRDAGGGYLAVRMNNDCSIDVSNPQDGSVVASSAASQFGTGAHTARVELDMTVTGGSTVPFTVRVWYDGNIESTGTPDTTLSGTLSDPGHSDVNSMYWGLTYPSGQNPTFNLWIDDVAVMASQSAGMIGPTTLPTQSANMVAVDTGEAEGAFTTTSAVSTTMAGKATDEALGLLSRTPGVVSMALVGIGSGEALGVPTRSPGAVSAALVAISSAEGLGAFTASIGTLSLSMVGIATGEAEGVFGLTIGPVSITMAGLASAQALGVPALIAGAASAIMAAIASAEAAGNFNVTLGGVSATLIGIASGEAEGVFGVTTGSASVALVGVVSAEALGLPSSTTGGVSVTLIGVASAEALGLPSRSAGGVSLTLVAIASAEALGLPARTPGAVSMTVPGVATAEAVQPFSTAAALSVVLAGLASAEAEGVLSWTAAISAQLAGLASAEVVNPFVLSSGGIITQMLAIATAEALGTPATSLGAVSTALLGIASAGAFGVLSTVLGPVFGNLAGLASAGAMGTPTASIGALVAAMLPIASAESVQVFGLVIGAATATIPSIGDQSAMGAAPTVLFYFNAPMVGIDSAEVVPGMGANIWRQMFFPDPIDSQEDFGLIDFDLAAVKFFLGVSSQQAVGAPTITLLAIIGYLGGKAIVVLAGGAVGVVDSRGLAGTVNRSNIAVIEEDDLATTKTSGGVATVATTSSSGRVRMT